MKVQTKGGVVTVKYRDETNVDETASVRVSMERGGAGVRVDLHRAGQNDMTLHLSAYDAMALTVALEAAEVSAPPPK